MWIVVIPPCSSSTPFVSAVYQGTYRLLYDSRSSHISRLLGYADSEYVVENISVHIPQSV